MGDFLKILAIDDNEDDQRLYRRALHTGEFELSRAMSVSEGVASFDADRPDVVLLDYNLPNVQGLAFMSKMRERDIRVPVIMLTGEGNEAVAVEAMKAGVNDYLIKDVSGNYLRLLPGIILRTRKTFEEKIKSNRIDKLHRAILKTVDHGILGIDHECAILFSNAAADLMLRLPEGALIGQSIRHFILSDKKNTKEGMHPLTKPCTRPSVVLCETDQFLRSDGSSFPTTYTASPLDFEGDGHYGWVMVFQDITRQKQMEQSLKRHQERLTFIAYHDALTGLPNRSLLTDRLCQQTAFAKRSGKMLAVVYLDLDDFKPINDTHGHNTGDKVLIEIARRMTGALRDSDTVARIGGDEFIILLAEQTNRQEIEKTMCRLFEACSSPMRIDSVDLTVTASSGISLFPDDGDDPDILMRNADQAMYRAKRSGRNRFHFFEQDRHEMDIVHGQMLQELSKAIETNQLSVVFQPIVVLCDSRIKKAEALVRWNHPSLGPVPPDVFIPLAENGGLIDAIGNFVFKQAVRFSAKWNQFYQLSGDEQPCKVAVNCSPLQFRNVQNLEEWTTFLKKENCTGEMLSIEITESVLLDNSQEVNDQLNRMHDLGMTLSLDDFGTGYSALSYLKKFPIDFLKIDRSFVSDIDKNESSRAIVESIIAMARRLNIQLIAEGVESSAQADLLTTAGCHMAQGYYFAEPMPENTFLDFIGSRMNNKGIGTRFRDKIDIL